MVTMQQVRATWSGWPGAPGVSTFWFTGLLDTDVVAVKSFFTNIADRLPNGVTVTIPSGGLTYDSGTGQPNGDWVAPATGGTVTGTGGLNYAAAAGAVVTWQTDVYLSGRRLRGRTFLVPLSAGAFDATGGLAAVWRTDLQAAANNLVTGTNLIVYSARSSATADVTSAVVPQMAAILKSRR